MLPVSVDGEHLATDDGIHTVSPLVEPSASVSAKSTHVGKTDCLNSFK